MKDGLLTDPDQMIEEGQASLDAYEASVVPLEAEVVKPFKPSSGPPPNWFEKVALAKRQDRLLRQVARLLANAIATLDNDIYATRWANARAYIEDAFDELKTDYAPEGADSYVYGWFDERELEKPDTPAEIEEDNRGWNTSVQEPDDHYPVTREDIP